MGRTQEVAGSSPASSIRVFAANARLSAGSRCAVRMLVLPTFYRTPLGVRPPACKAKWDRHGRTPHERSYAGSIRPCRTRRDRVGSPARRRPRQRADAVTTHLKKVAAREHRDDSGVTPHLVILQATLNGSASHTARDVIDGGHVRPSREAGDRRSRSAIRVSYSPLLTAEWRRWHGHSAVGFSDRDD
jgi:hypothetical protein